MKTIPLKLYCRNLASQYTSHLLKEQQQVTTTKAFSSWKRYHRNSDNTGIQNSEKESILLSRMVSLSEVKLQPTQSWITGSKFLNIVASILHHVGRWHNCTKYCCSNCSNHTKLFSPLVQLSLVGLTGHAISDSIWANLHPRLHALWSHGCVSVREYIWEWVYQQ